MRKFLINNILIIIVTIIAITGSTLFVYSEQDQKLEIVFLDVGQGDAIFITTPNGRQILVDTGAQNNLGQKLAQHMSVSDRSLDMVIMTHPDLDHVGGILSLIDRYKIDAVVHSGLQAGAPIYSVIADNIISNSIQTIKAHAGQVIKIDEQVFLEVYAPAPHIESFEANEYSVVMKLVYKNTSVT